MFLKLPLLESERRRKLCTYHTSQGHKYVCAYTWAWVWVCVEGCGGVCDSHPSGKQTFLLLALKALKVGPQPPCSMPWKFCVWRLGGWNRAGDSGYVCVYQCAGSSEINYQWKALASQRLGSATMLPEAFVNGKIWSAIHKTWAVRCWKEG